MAQGAASVFQVIAHTPGNPQLPVLPNPNDPKTGLDDPFGGGASISARRATIVRLRQLAAGPDISRGFAQTWLNKIGGFPNPIDFGNITAPKQATVTVHSTNRNPVTVSAITPPAGSGVVLLSPALPVVLEPFSSAVFTFQASLTGDPSFDGNTSFITTAGDFDIRFLGRRVLIFQGIPEEPIIESVSFGTDVMIASSGKEQVMSWRRTPRSNAAFTVREDNDARRTRLLNSFMGAGQLLHGVNLWWQAQYVSAVAVSASLTALFDTTSMEIAVGDTVGFILPDLTTFDREVASLTPTSVTFTQALGTDVPLGTFVMPVKFGYMSPTSSIRTFPVNVEDINVSFTLIDYENIGAVDPTYFATHPVDGLPIPLAPLEFDGRARAAAVGSDDDRLDSRTGDIANRRNQLIGRPEQTVKVTCQNRAQQFAWRRFLHFVRGSWGRFYVPTGTNDLPVQTVFALGTTTFDIEQMGVASLLGNIAPRRDVKITITDVTGEKTSYYRRINSVTDNATFETVVLDSLIPGSGTLTPDQVQIEWLTLCRIIDDTGTFRHLNGGISELRFGIRGVIES